MPPPPLLLLVTAFFIFAWLMGVFLVYLKTCFWKVKLLQAALSSILDHFMLLEERSSSFKIF